MAQAIDKVYCRLVTTNTMDAVDLIFGALRGSVVLYQPTLNEEYLSRYTREDKIATIKQHVFGSGHVGALEHVSLTFEIVGVSRSMTHQAVRNRIASYLESSMRYIPLDNKNFRYILPFGLRGKIDTSEWSDEQWNRLCEVMGEDITHEIEEDVEGWLKNRYHTVMCGIEQEYSRWRQVGLLIGLDDGRSKELGRTVLPQCSATKYVFTMNLASVLRLLSKRLCSRAEDEFRMIMDALVAAMLPKFDWLVEQLVPYCEQHGYCPEGDDKTCGKVVTKEELLRYYRA